MSYEKIGWQPGVKPFINANNLDHMDGGIQLAHQRQHAQVAKGTGVAIFLDHVSFDDGLMMSFIVVEDNGGVNTTINGKPLYKPGTTSPPNLKAGKNVTIWYQESGDCFFFKASAEGNASVSHVLAEKTFSNDDDTGLVGAMPHLSGEVSPISLEGLEGSLKVLVKEGYTDGVNDKVVLSDDQFIAKNIRQGTTLFGLVGSLVPLPTEYVPGDSSIYFDTKVYQPWERFAVFQRAFEVSFAHGGSVKVSFMHGLRYSDGRGYAEAELRLNGVPVGTNSLCNYYGYKTTVKTIDLLPEGGNLSLWIRNTSWATDQGATQAKNFTILVDESGVMNLPIKVY